MPRNDRDDSNDYDNGDDNRAPGRSRYGEYDAANDDYEREMRYGRSGLVSGGGNDDRDYSIAYRSSGQYDEDDYDSNYGSSRDYDDQSFRRRPGRDYYGSEYQRDDYRRGVSDHGRGGAWGDRPGYRSGRDYGRDDNRNYSRLERTSGYGRSYGPDESESEAFRRRFTSNYRNDY